MLVGSSGLGEMGVIMGSSGVWELMWGCGRGMVVQQALVLQICRGLALRSCVSVRGALPEAALELVCWYRLICQIVNQALCDFHKPRV